MTRAWISLSEAARRMDAPAHAVRRLVDKGQLTVREIPFTQPRVLAAEVEAITASHTRPARQPAA